MNNKVTIEDVKANMKDRIVRTVIEFGKPCTYVTVRMLNGFTVRESTTCVDPANYDEKIGAKICLEKIEDKVWLLLGYELQSKLAAQPKSLYFHSQAGDGIGFVHNGTAYSVDYEGHVTTTTDLSNIVYIESLTVNRDKPITSEVMLEVGHTYVAFSTNSDFNHAFKVIDNTLFGKELMLADDQRGVYTSPAFSVDDLRNYAIYEVSVTK